MALMQRGFLAAALGALAAARPGCGAESNSKPAAPVPRAHLVELAVAEPGRLSYAADRAGSLRAVREVRIVNQEEGRLTEVRQREGDRVRAGEVLVRYDDRILRGQLAKATASGPERCWCATTTASCAPSSTRRAPPSARPSSTTSAAAS